MIDLHSHVLPGIDDGTANVSEALELAAAAAAGGTRVLAATPHLRADHPGVRPGELAGRCRELNGPLAFMAIVELPYWKTGTPAVLCVEGPHAIPISTAVRAASDQVLFALGRERETLRRLHRDPSAALCLLGDGVAFTAHGQVRIVGELDSADTVVAVELSVARVQDHLRDGRTQMLDGARWRWLDERAAAAEPSIVAELERLRGGDGR